jgi:hypothetical protein
MTWQKQLTKLRRLLQLTLVLLVSSNTYLGIWSGTAVKADVVEMSPGKILPQDYNHYLGTPDVQVKLEFSKAIILQQAKGDLVFNVTTRTRKGSIAIYIPPEFGISRGSRYVWTSITNDYRSISMSTLSDRDPIAPDWWRVLVSGSISSVTSNIIRVFNVTAPSIVGRYFFKVYTDGISIGAKNFPTLVVSADINPAYISGTVLDGWRDSSRYGHPIQLEQSQGGRVVAEGITPQGRRVVAQAFFNANDSGRYTLYGLAPGTYRLIASVAGYYNTTRPEPVSVVRGQSLEGADIFANPSPRLEGIVWSKCSGLLQPWGAIAEYPAPGDGAALVAAQGFIYALRGADTSSFLQYDPGRHEWNSYPASTPGLVGAGGALAYDGDKYIYALGGGRTNSFWSFDTRNQPQGSWQAENNTHTEVNAGGALVYHDGYIYALAGGGSTYFGRYKPRDPREPGDWWTDCAYTEIGSTTYAIGAGGALVSDGTYIYALVGGGSSAFLRYDPTANSWDDSLPSPGNVNAGGALVYDGTRYIYALRGITNDHLWCYDTSSPGWSDLGYTPDPVGPGGSLAFMNGKVYVLRGEGYEDFWSWSPDPSPGGTWTHLANFPFTYRRSITIEILDSLGNSKRLLQNSTDPDSDRFDFSYDGTTQLDGHIPQNESGYVSGIAPGTHIVQVWVNQYIQPDTIQLPGTVTQITGVQVQLSSYEPPTRIQLDVHKSGRAEILVNFKNFPELKQATSVDSTRAVTIKLYDHNRVLRAQNSTNVSAGDSSGIVILTGFLGTQRDYGLPMDTYIIGATVNGYYQPSDAFVSVGGCNSKEEVSLEVIRTGSLKVTILSVDSQRPSVLRNWRYQDATIKMEVRDQYGVQIYASNSTRQNSSNHNVTLSVTGLRTGMYSIYVFTFGYIQTSSYFVFVKDGATSDTVVKIVQGGLLDLTVILEKEDVLTTIDTFPFSSEEEVPIRIQVLDAYQRFVAANATYVSSNENTIDFRLAGFKDYAGNYIDWRWVNYYDTTDGAVQRDYGLDAGSYTFIVYLPGFSQSETYVTAQLPVDGVSSVVLRLNRLAHFSGSIYSFNMFDELVPLNWVTVDIAGETMQDYTSTLDGSFDMWLEKGDYLVMCSLDGYAPTAVQLSLPKGADISIELYLEPLQS